MDDVRVEHQPGKFFATIAGQEAYILYELRGEILDLLSTYTPPLRGRNLAARLTEAAFAYAKERNLKIKPTCSYTQAYLQRHPELNAISVN